MITLWRNPGRPAVKPIFYGKRRALNLAPARKITSAMKRALAPILILGTMVTAYVAGPGYSSVTEATAVGAFKEFYRAPKNAGTIQGSIHTPANTCDRMYVLAFQGVLADSLVPLFKITKSVADIAGSAIVDDTGAFSIEHLAPGTYTIVLVHIDQSMRESLSEARHQTLQMPQNGTVTILF